MLLQIMAKGFKIGEISCPTRYFGEASSLISQEASPMALAVSIGVFYFFWVDVISIATLCV